MSTDHAPRKRSLAWWAARIAVGLALVAAAMAGVAWWMIESLDLKQVVARVEHAAAEITGRKVTIGSKPQLSFTPLLKLVVRDITLGNMEGGTRSEMMTLARLEIGISLTPLLEGERPGLNLTLIEPDLLLEVTERGERNWALKLSPEEALARLKEAIAILDGKINLETARIERATVRFDDRQDRRALTLTVRRAELELGKADDYTIDLDAGLNSQPITVQAAFRVPGPGELVPARVKASLPGMDLSAEGVVRPKWPTQGTDFKLALDIRDLSLLGNTLGLHLNKLPSGKLEARLQGTAQGMRADPLHLTLGHSSLDGNVEITRFEPRPQIRATLEGPVLDLAELVAATGKTVTSPQPTPGDGRLFPATRLPLEKLQILDVESQFKIGRLVLPGARARTVEELQGHLSLAGARLKIDPFALAIGPGRISGRIRMDAPSAKTATVETELQAKNAHLGSLLAFAGLPAHEIKGAPTDMAIKLTSSGDSVRTLMAGLNGQVRVVVGEGRMPGKLASFGGSVIGQALDIANPYREKDDGSILKCAVVNVPIQRGVVTINDTVAAETDKVVGAVSGNVDLGEEHLDIILHSQATGGVGLADFASAGKITGTLAKPQLAVNVQGAAVAGLRVGAAIASFGVTEIAGALARKAMPSHPCEAALGAKAGEKSANGQATGTPDTAEKKPGFFGRMLGK